MLLTKPDINFFAGWHYLFNHNFRNRTNKAWQKQPTWLVVVQMISGACSVLFPGIILALLGYVLLVNHVM